MRRKQYLCPSCSKKYLPFQKKYDWITGKWIFSNTSEFYEEGNTVRKAKGFI